MISKTAAQVMEALRPAQTQSKPLMNLKTGQFIEAKVVKLYPGQRADIMVGTERLHAQLEAALDVQKRYLFQVKQDAPTPQLNVITSTSAASPAKELLQQLHTTSSARKEQFVQTLLNHQVPINAKEVNRALTILDQEGFTAKGKEAMTTLLTRKLPVTEGVFQALLTRVKGEGATPSMTSQVQQLHSSSSQPLQQLLHQLSGRTTHEIPRVVTAALTGTHSDEALSLLQKVNLIPKEGGREAVKSYVQHLSRNVESGNQISAVMKEAVSKQLPFTNKGSQQLALWANGVERLQENTSSSLKEGMIKLTNVLLQPSTLMKLEGAFPSVPVRENLTTLAKALQNETPLQESVRTELVQFGRALRNELSEQLTKQEIKLALQWIASAESSAPLGKEGALAKLKSAFLFSGFDHEFEASKATDPMKAPQADSSVKAALLYALQENGGANGERIQSLLHQVTGMQLSLQEQHVSTHMHVQFPGEWLGLTEDVEFDVEGRKKEDGTIDPDYCHILFYLHLDQLKETVVDMHVQNRTVRLNIYVSNEAPSQQIEPLKETLKNGLHDLGYTLSGVLIKPVESSAEAAGRQEQKRPFAKREGGLDFRI
ncbi:hypothetical protein N781_12295 [Pontibacillus halophilus JSM 076056 = DSM 19796]|uniref:Uncharacterized protein n=1 Tax=Pontibacillus halophilus JSM 076056 = DSM 19796 TaxID=1385510 RepID=A0A0A5GQ78_9BACI|nr:hypothetical protein [Pontibacillus halophilus]KGX93330.1 hypothetical protein N781_12295 [Pontibacillus halophilus JSM 076056 = DSM 19796]